MKPANITHRPCPRCGGKLEFRDTVESHTTAPPVDFFGVKTAATFMQSNTNLLSGRAGGNYQKLVANSQGRTPPRSYITGMTLIPVSGKRSAT